MTAAWMTDGLCQLPAYRPLYTERRPHGMSRRDHTATAKGVCRRCPVIGSCREFTLELEGTVAASHRDGVAGGLTARERAAIGGADTSDEAGAA